MDRRPGAWCVRPRWAAVGDSPEFQASGTLLDLATGLGRTAVDGAEISAPQSAQPAGDSPLLAVREQNMIGKGIQDYY